VTALALAVAWLGARGVLSLSRRRSPASPARATCRAAGGEVTVASDKIRTWWVSWQGIGSDSDELLLPFVRRQASFLPCGGERLPRFSFVWKKPAEVASHGEQEQHDGGSIESPTAVRPPLRPRVPRRPAVILLSSDGTSQRPGCMGGCLACPAIDRPAPASCCMCPVPCVAALLAARIHTWSHLRFLRPAQVQSLPRCST
jgi:hypothetical protein